MTFVSGQEVVQRLFEDQEDEQGGNLLPSADQPNKDSTTRVDDICSKEEQQEEATRPLFPQTPQRESVIFFSTGKKLLRAPCFELQDNSACEKEEKEDGQFPSVQDKLLLAHEKAPCTSEPTGHISPSALQTGSSALCPAASSTQCFVPQDHTCLRLHHRPRCAEDLLCELCSGDAA